MKKLILALLLSLLTLPTFALWKMYPHTGKLDYYESGTDQVGTVTNGKWCVGDADAMVQCTEDAPAGSGDVTDVGDCTGGACLDGTSDGGTYISFYDAQGATKFQVGDNTGAITLTLPVATGTLFLNNVSATDKLLGRVSAGAGSIEEVTMTDFAQSILDDANEAAFKATVNLEIGTDVQAYDADLTTYAGITPSANVQTMLGSANNAAILSNIGAQATVTEGSLADSVIVSADIKDGTIAGGDLASNIAITSTGAQDFGGASDFEIPNAAAPTVNAAGEIAIDTTSDQLVYYGGAKRVLTHFYEKGFVLENPTDADDNVPFWHPKQNITITDCYCETEGGTSAVVTISDGTNALEAITCDADGQADDGSIANGTFTANERMEFDIGTVTGEVDWVAFTITYTIDAD